MVGRPVALAAYDVAMRSFVDEISVAEPCGVDWDSMVGDERGRYCGQCRQTVYQLSSLSREEIGALIARDAGALCVRFERRGDGSVVVREPRPLGAARRWLAAAGVMLTLEVASGVAHADLSAVSAKAPKVKPRTAKGRGVAEAPSGTRRLPVLPDELVEHVPTAPESRTTTMGAISPQSLRPNMTLVRACYQSALVGKPDLSGRMTLKFTVVNGRVEHAELQGSTLEDLAMEQCIVEAAKSWQFPASESPATVSYPLVFSPSW